MLHFSKEDIQIILQSIICEHLSHKNGAYFPLHSGLDGDLTREPFSFDSLGLVALATQVGDFFGVNRVGLEEYFLRYRDLQSWVGIIQDSLKRYDETLVFMTSGTTSKPKRIEHKVEKIIKEGEFLSTLFQNIQSIEAFVRPHHIYGFLYSIVLPKLLQKPIHHHEPLPSREFFKIPSNSLIIATPTICSQLDLFGEIFPNNTQLSTSTEPMPRETYELLEQKGVAKIYEFYGSSESIGIGYKNSFDSAFKLFDYLHKNSLSQIQDNLEFIDDTHFYVKGRIDKLVKHRGYKLNLQDYEKKINLIPSVKEARTSISKGLLVCFIKSDEKNKTMEAMASMEIKPDQIVWI